MMKSHSYENQGVAVVGLGKSGLATARRLAEGHARVFVWDDNEKGRVAAKSEGLAVQNFDPNGWPDTRTIVLSPGIPLTHPKPHPVVEYASAHGMEVIGDVEVFLKEKTAGKLVGITGTNGKSTTSALIHHILESAYRETALGGNIGTPVMDLPQLSKDGVYVLELSSYQLDLTPSWHGDVSVLLNITPDHLDRHGGMQGYIDVKKKIFQKQTAPDTAVINLDDPICKAIAAECVTGQRLIPFSTENRLKSGLSACEGLLQLHENGVVVWEIDLNGISSLRGAHNWQNAAAASAVCWALGLSAEEIRTGLETFGGLAHRMEQVLEEGVVRYINDSKATNAEAAAKSLGAFENIYWICGGVAKAGGIDSLEPYFNQVRHAFLIGECAAQFAKTLEGKVPYTLSVTLEQAVKDARELVENSTNSATVLLAPAAASFDQFGSFEERGNAFRQFVTEGGGE
ncbi:UDP-N-acetylmuramoyl-L-alanine--D-glutamate ligase [Sneathiella limimaris]|uniref:UDP-N-acetylmuramoyl-L-alanine--D-glutamate ligase n=1 Tax=Sneathiella limimaris TaxID=1964213 RepID=UPI001469F6A5|nr:UDP-N-acetylmuramoyl-L-alanine--D-glutamate ligase [Sneathiella limimaris]